MDHLQTQLEEKGVQVSTELIYALCFVTDNRELSTLMGNPSWADLDFNDRCADIDTYVTLCCSHGIVGLKKQLGKHIKIIPGMRNSGTCQLFLTLDPSKEFVVIDQDRSTITQRKYKG